MVTAIDNNSQEESCRPSTLKLRVSKKVLEMCFKKHGREMLQSARHFLKINSRRVGELIL